VTAVTTQWQS